MQIIQVRFNVFDSFRFIPGISLFFALLFVTCSTPSWIHRLPPEDPGYQIDIHTLQGLYVRNTESRFGVANPLAVSHSMEWILIGYNGADSYRKVHLYYESIKQSSETAESHHVLREGYREEGRIRIQGAYILFEPQSSYAAEDDGLVPFDQLQVYQGERDSYQALAESALLQRLDPIPHYRANFAGSPQRRRKPLLFFYHELNSPYITPLAYERMGRIYRWGVYEGTTEAFDSDSSTFYMFLELQNKKRFHPHGYERVSSMREHFRSEDYRPDRFINPPLQAVPVRDLPPLSSDSDDRR